jgi:hypothetical protein
MVSVPLHGRRHQIKHIYVSDAMRQRMLELSEQE